MDDISVQLLESYRQLVFLFQEQIAVANKETYDNQLDEIKSLEDKKVEYISYINQTRLDPHYDRVIDNHRETVTHYINQLSEMNDILIKRINELYAEASRDMKQVTTQRKTLQSYGGVNYSDVISYYFDEKK